MKFKFLIKAFTRITSFILMFLLALASFNLFSVEEKLQMLQVANNFHNGQISNDKELIDNSLSDSFTETGAKIAVSTPDFIYKKDLMNNDYSGFDLNIGAQYLVLLNLFSNNNKSLSFIKKFEMPTDSDNEKNTVSIHRYVTYYFEEQNGKLKIKKIIRNF